MDAKIISECNKVLKKLGKIQDSIPFKQPVDYIAYQLPDYPDIIKNPMDLGTIESNLKAKKYKSSKEFFDDIQLVWNNCKTYNQEASGIYLQALNMEKATNQFRQEFEASKKQPALSQQQQQTGSNAGASSGVGGKKKNVEKSAVSSVLKKKITKNKEGNSSITANTNINSVVGNSNQNQSQPVTTSQYSKKEKAPPQNKNEQPQDKYANLQERKYAHTSLRLNLAFKLKNANEDKLVNLFAMLAERYPDTLGNIESREQKFSMNLTLLPDQIVQDMIAALEFKD